MSGTRALLAGLIAAGAHALALAAFAPLEGAPDGGGPQGDGRTIRLDLVAPAAPANAEPAARSAARSSMEPARAEPVRRAESPPPSPVPPAEPAEPAEPSVAARIEAATTTEPAPNAIALPRRRPPPAASERVDPPPRASSEETERPAVGSAAGASAAAAAKPAGAQSAHSETPAEGAGSAALSNSGDPATSAALDAARIAYAKRVAEWLERHKRAPRGALGRGADARGSIRIVVARDGAVIDRGVIESAGRAAIDHAMEAMVDSAAPLPAFPPDLTLERIELIAPVRFSARR